MIDRKMQKSITVEESRGRKVEEQNECKIIFVNYKDQFPLF